ncbi:MAG: DUF6445 family protein [Pseudomonadota bacterium]
MLITRIVLDDFFDDPLAVRKQALSLEYPDPKEGANYPGRTSEQRLALPGGDAFFSRLTQQPLQGAADADHYRFRYSWAGAARRGDVHIDPGVEWSGIIYLTPDEHCRPEGGTKFFRHKATGAEARPMTDKEAQDKYGFETRVKFLEATVAADSLNPDAWDVVDQVPMKFNRCVLFRPWQFHAGGEDFGTGLEDGRFVQLLFFKQGKPPQKKA